MADLDDIVSEAKDRLKLCLDAEGDFREQAEDDLIFAFADKPEDQWDQNVLQQRGERPCYTYNEVGQAIDQVVADQRMARPAIKIRPVDGESDPELADIYNGLIRNIEALSDAESIYDDAFSYSVGGGFGYWRVLPEYADEESFNQELYVRPVESQFGVYLDPAAKHSTKMDAKWGLLSVWVDRDDYEDDYGEEAMAAFEASTDSERENWVDEDQIRIAEYYRKVPKRLTLYEFADGSVIRSDRANLIMDELKAERGDIKREREVVSMATEWYKLSGFGVLEGPIEYACPWIPIVRVCGKRLVIGNTERIKGITRDAKDAQRSYNYMRSDLAEDVLMRPKAPVFLSTKTLENKKFRDIWKNAHKVLMNALPFIPDASDLKGGGAPIPNTTTGLDAGKLAVAQQDLEDIKRTTGHFDPALGDAQDNAQMSGIALQRWQNRAGAGSFVYHDNLAKAIQQTGRILVSYIPIIYDTERVIRILGRDGTEDFVKINAASMERGEGEPRPLGDITTAKFDVTVDTGPSFATQREEASTKMMDLGKSWPTIYELASDVIAQGIDIPNQDELVKRLRKRLISQGMVDPNMEDPDEKALAEQMQAAGQNDVLNQLVQAQAREADANAAESQASTAEKQARAEKIAQDAIAQWLENQILERKLRIDPDGIIEVFKKTLSTGA